MNKKQRIVLGLGLLLVILNGLFPPFENKDGRKLGYHLLFTPPSREWGYPVDFSFLLIENGKKDGQQPGWQPVYGARVVTSVFFIQFVTIVGATAGAFLLFGRGNILSEKK